MTIHRSPLPDVEIPDVSITEYVLRKASELANTPALIDGVSGEEWTFSELSDKIHSFAGGLAAKGFGPGSTLAIMAPNLPWYAVVFHGAATAGGTITTVNPTYTADEVRHQLQDSGATILVVVAAAVEVAAAAIEGTDVTEVFLIGAPEAAPSIEAPSVETLMGDPISQVAIDNATHTVVLPYSSGTTGLPKGVMLSHTNLVANLAQSEHVLIYDDDELALAVLPFFHIYGMQVLMNGLLAEGVGVITLPRFDLVAALELIQTRKVTRLYAVPPMVLALAKQPVIDSYDLASLRSVVSGAAPLGAEVALEAADRIGCEVVQAYGMTELSPVSHATPPGGFKPGSSGLTVSNTEVRIVNEEGEDQPLNAEGELWVRGPQVMLGYLNNDEATAATVTEDGWLRTGDVAVLDDDGHMFIVDRLKELIKYKGFQVPPAELEAMLLTHPGIGDCAVIGIPDQEAGELPKAFVVCKPDTEVSETDVLEFISGQVASYKQIRIVEFIDEIPKSASGKILRRFLRDRA